MLKELDMPRIDEKQEQKLVDNLKKELELREKQMKENRKK